MYQLGDTLRAMSWFLYLIECRDGSLYTGITTDVARRYAQHVSGKGARYTRAHPPLQLLGAVECPDRSTASRAEYALKQRKPAEKRLWLTQQLRAGKKRVTKKPATEKRAKKTTKKVTSQP